MFLAIYILLIFIGIFTKNKIKYYDFIIFAFLGLITYSATDVADFENYERAYNFIAAGNEYSDLGYGWYYLCMIGIKLGLNYRLYKTVILLISCLMTRSTICLYIRKEENSQIVWSLYLLFPALLDCIQIRFFFAEAIFFFSTRFLVNKKKSGYIIYLFLILLSSTIHSSTLFYLMFLFIPFFDKIKKVLINAIILLSIILLLLQNQVINLASLFVNRERIERYFYSGDSVGPFGFVAYSITLFLFIFITNNMYKLVKSNTKLSEKVNSNFYDMIKQMSVIVCSLFPLCTFDTNFFRLQRPLWFMLYIAAIMLFENDVRFITINKYNVRIKNGSFWIALVWNVCFICVFTFSAIRSFLL